MKTVVKYANRKLYDKETAKYITIAELLKLPLGSFKVIRHGGEEDITTDTLLSGLTTVSVTDNVKVEVMQYCIDTLTEDGELFT